MNSAVISHRIDVFINPLLTRVDRLLYNYDRVSYPLVLVATAFQEVMQ